MAITNYFRSDGWVKSVTGAAIAGAQVYVCAQPANVASAPPSPLALIYSDPNGLVPITQPIITDGFGHYNFYALAGLYTVVVALGGLIQQVYPDQSLGGVGTGTGGTGLVIQVNGSVVANQLVLNLQQGNGISLAADSSGDVTISGAVFQTNGVNNPVQGLLNLKAGVNISVAADGAGGVTITGSQQGVVPSYMVSSGIFDFVAAGATATALLAIAGVANQVNVLRFTLLAGISGFTHLDGAFGSGLGGGSTFAIGFYDVNGNLLQTSGPLSIVNGSNLTTSYTIPTLTLAAGTYYFAWTASDTSAQSMGWTSPITIGFRSGTSDSNVINQSTVMFGKAANPAGAGSILPATLGALTAINGTLTPAVPVVMYH
jgi:hypothetical protein